MKLSMTIAGVLAVSVLALGAAAAAPPPQSVEVACRGIPEAENHLAVLLSTDDVLRVEPLTAREHVDDPTVPTGEGARIVIAAQPFVTSAWLQQAVDCHRARNASAGGATRASRSPLDVGGTTIAVTAAPGTLTVNIATADRHAAREVLARSMALQPRR
jgi:hypothetical protein